MVFIERSWEMEERSWWDLWNSSFRSEDSRDEISSNLFAHVLGVFRDITGGRGCRILEVACGTGILSRNLTFSSYHGLNLSAAVGCTRECHLIEPSLHGHRRHQSSCSYTTDRA